MVNVRIEIREDSVKGDEKFNVAMIAGKDSALEANVEYCPCCFYKLDVTKKKVQKLMLACFELEHARTGKVSKEHESFLAGDVYNFNIILENKIVNDKLPLMNGIVIKEKHVIKEETDILKSLHDNMMFAKTIADIKNNISKKECNGEKSIFGTKRKEDKSELPIPETEMFVSHVTLHDGSEYNIIENNVFKQPFLNILKDFHLTNGNDNDDLIIIKNTSADIRAIAEMVFKLTESKSITVIYFGDYYYISCNNSFKEMTYKEKDKMDEILLRYSGVDLYIINK